MHASSQVSASGDRAALLDVLGDAGWSQASHGPIGELWASPEGVRVGVPYGISHGDWEWAGVLERIAAGMRLAVDDVESLLRRLWTDEFDFRAGTTLASRHTINAASGSALFRNVWQVLRSSATAAQKPQPRITNWSIVGDRAVADAQFGQTRPGSYILPLLVPLRATTTAQETPGDPKLPDTEVRSREPEERRVTRTMIDALEQLRDIVITPDRIPSAEAVNELVYRGVTRNMLASVKGIIEHNDVNSLDITPKWATRVPIGRSASSARIEIPAESAHLLEQTIPKFKRAAASQTEVLSGPIFRMQHRTGERFGVATIDTRRNGRPANVDVYLSAGEGLEQAHDWFKQHETVEARGKVESSNSGLNMRRPDSFRALGEAVLL